jgi:hypothetical protein
MPDSQNPDHVRKLIEEFQLKGANLIPTITGEIVPTVLVADLTAEARAADRLCSGGRIGAAAGAGDINSITLYNPGNSGVLCLLDEIWVAPETADVVGLVITKGIPGTGTFQAFRDTRIPGEPVCGSTAATPAGIVLGIPQYAVPATVTTRIPVRYAIGPGYYFGVLQVKQNETLVVNFMWRERDLQPGE